MNDDNSRELCSRVLSLEERTAALEASMSSTVAILGGIGKKLERIENKIDDFTEKYITTATSIAELKTNWKIFGVVVGIISAISIILSITTKLGVQ